MIKGILMLAFIVLLAIYAPVFLVILLLLWIAVAVAVVLTLTNN